MYVRRIFHPQLLQWTSAKMWVLRLAFVTAAIVQSSISAPLEPGQPGGPWTKDEIDIVRDKVIFLFNT